MQGQLHAEWSINDGVDCVRISGADAALPESPPWQVHRLGSTPVAALAGLWHTDNGDRCFIPRFPFRDGSVYQVTMDSTVLTLERVRAKIPRSTTVLGIFPSSPLVPQNLLRFSIEFSAAMSEGFARQCISVVDDSTGKPFTDVLLASDHELWNPGRTRLTVLLDPSRIKTGLFDHERSGYPLLVGNRCRIVIDGSFEDATGTPLASAATRSYTVGQPGSRPLAVERWRPGHPECGTLDPLVITFDVALDRALLQSCLAVYGSLADVVTPTRIDGVVTVGPGELTWSFTPAHPWGAGPHHLRIDPILEDQAGNSLRRAFDTELDALQHAADRSAGNSWITLAL